MRSKPWVWAVTFGLAALYETVEGFDGGLPFALDADGCVVDYQPKCAAQGVHPHCVCASPASAATSPDRLVSTRGSVDYYPPERRMMGGAAGISHHTATKAEDFSISYHKTYKVWRSAP